MMSFGPAPSSQSQIKRESGRIKDSESGRVLDEATRQRRHRKALDALEQDNFHSDPHSDLTWNRKRPKFADEPTNAAPQMSKSKKKTRGQHFKQRFRKTFAALLEEEQIARPEPPNYFTAEAPPSKIPPRHFCSICGFYSVYTCTRCGTRYCSIKCHQIHTDTRYARTNYNFWGQDKIFRK